MNKLTALRNQGGFNLIELMIVVAIVGIIAAIAYPSYQRQLQDTRRADCSGALVGLGNAMERFYSVNGSYLEAAAGGADTGAPAVFSTSCPIDGNTPTYDITIEAAEASTYLLHAAPTGVQTDDKCGTLSYSNTGVKNVVGADAGVTWQDCW